MVETRFELHAPLCTSSGFGISQVMAVPLLVQIRQQQTGRAVAMKARTRLSPYGSMHGGARSDNEPAGYTQLGTVDPDVVRSRHLPQSGCGTKMTRARRPQGPTQDLSADGEETAHVGTYQASTICSRSGSPMVSMTTKDHRDAYIAPLSTLTCYGLSRPESMIRSSRKGKRAV
jgi:hypothetical protein